MMSTHFLNRKSKADGKLGDHPSERLAVFESVPARQALLTQSSPSNSIPRRNVNNSFYYFFCSPFEFLLYYINIYKYIYLRLFISFDLFSVLTSFA